MREPEVRKALVGYLANQPDLPEDALIVNEINVCEGAARVDVALVTDHLHGYEIKSRVDTMSRWAEQIACYQMVFERVTIVIGVNHLTKALAEIPTWCGLMLASPSGGELEIEPFRDCAENPNRDRYRVAQLLWRDEALAVLTAKGKDRGVRSKTRPVIWERVAESLSLEEITEEVCAAFKARDKTWRTDARLAQAKKPVVRRRRRKRRRRRTRR